MSESELYKELGALTKDKAKWKESLPYVASLLAHESSKIQAKAGVSCSCTPAAIKKRSKRIRPAL